MAVGGTTVPFFGKLGVYKQVVFSNYIARTIHNNVSSTSGSSWFEDLAESEGWRELANQDTSQSERLGKWGDGEFV